MALRYDCVVLYCKALQLMRISDACIESHFNFN